MRLVMLIFSANALIALLILMIEKNLMPLRVIYIEMNGKDSMALVQYEKAISLRNVIFHMKIIIYSFWSAKL